MAVGAGGPGSKTRGSGRGAQLAWWQMVVRSAVGMTRIRREMPDRHGIGAGVTHVYPAGLVCSSRAGQSETFENDTRRR